MFHSPGLLPLLRGISTLHPLLLLGESVSTQVHCVALFDLAELEFQKISQWLRL